MKRRRNPWHAKTAASAMSIALAVTLLATCVPPVQAQWHSAVGGTPARTGFVDTTGPTTPTRLWEGVRFTRYVRPVAVDEGRVFIQWNQAGSWYSEVVGLDIDDGTELWAVEVPTEGMIAEEERSRVTGARDGQVYATRSVSMTNPLPLYAYEAASGTLQWVSESLVGEGSVSSATFAPNGDVIIVGELSDGNQGILRINKDDGTTVWESPPVWGHTNDANGAVVFGDRVYAWHRSTAVAAIDLATGNLLYYSEQLPAGGAAVQQGLFCGLDGKIYAFRTGQYLYAFEDTGTELVIRWTYPAGSGYANSHGVGSDGSIYTQDNENHLVRLDAKDGSLIARSAEPIPGTDGINAPRMAIDAAGNAFVSSGSYSSGIVTAYDVDLNVLWSEYVSTQSVTGPALGASGELVVQTRDQGMIIYKVEECVGDLDGDGDVDLADLAILLSNYGMTSGATYEDGDLDGDEDVDLADLAELLSHYGESCP